MSRVLPSPIKVAALTTRFSHAPSSLLLLNYIPSCHKFKAMPTTDFNSLGGLGGDYMDDGDDLCDYNAEIPDIDTTLKPLAAPEDNKKDTLGIDEEVKIKKKRIVVKLDEARYILSVLAW